jgi:hypothetical protein
MKIEEKISKKGIDLEIEKLTQMIKEGINSGVSKVDPEIFFSRMSKKISRTKTISITMDNLQK